MLDIKADGDLVMQVREPRGRTRFDAPPIRHASDVLTIIANLLNIAQLQQEVFLVLALSGSNHLIRAIIVTMGLLDANQVHPREVFAPVIEARAASVIFVHNHPSGTLVASPEDIALTKRLVQAGQLLGIRVLDHIIVAENGHLSLKDAGYI